jgi:nitrogen fixation protein NifU and related proteins
MEYTETVWEHFNNPRNIGVIEDANIVVRAGDPSCGDGLLIFLKIADDRIIDYKYKIYGCGAAIATSSIASELAMGKTLDEVLAISPATIADALGGLPHDKMHCSNLASSALRTAVMHYRAKLEEEATAPPSPSEQSEVSDDAL